MAPKREQAPLLQKMSSLEVEPLDVLIYASEPEQSRRLDTLTTTSGDLDVAALLTGALPVDDHCCCCCCIPCSVCC